MYSASLSTMYAPQEALKLQHPLPDGTLSIVATGTPEDQRPEAA
jgi:hypothetical protein